MAFLIEILLLVGFFLACPIYDWRSFPGVRQAVSEGRMSRRKIYREFLVVQWSASALLTILWWKSGWSLDVLGLGWSGSVGAWSTVILVIFITALMVVQVLVVNSRAEMQRQTLQEFESADAMMPRNEGDFLWFSAVSFTAGFCEEFLYRGFLLWWFGTKMGLGSAWAAVAVTIAFGFAHIYLGWKGALRAGIMGGVFMGLRLLAGSIWPVVVLHTAVDLLAGYMVFSAWTQQKSRDQEPGRSDMEGSVQEGSASLL